MAFPVVESAVGTGRTAAETTSPVTYPATISAGALLVCIFRSASAGAIGWPADWNEIVEDSSDASDDVTAIAWRAAVGDEDGTTFNVTHGSGKAAAIVYSITGAADPTVQPPQLSTVAVGTSTLPDPTTATPTGGARDYLWLWLGGWEGEQTSPPASTPLNYTNSYGASTAAAGVVALNCRVASAQRNLNAASENPPSWTISASDDWSAWAMAVHPASTDRAGEVSWAELEVPNAPRAAEVSWAEVEVPESAGVKAEVSWAEVEVPDAPRQAEVSWAEVEIPAAPRAAEVSWAEVEVPVAPRAVEVSWAEVEVPNAPPTYTSYGGVFLWTAANWGSVNIYLEVYLRATVGTVYARLIDSDNNPVTDSEVSTNQTTFQRLRSLALTLVNNKTYRSQFGKAGSDAGEFLEAKLIVIPV